MSNSQAKAEIASNVSGLLINIDVPDLQAGIDFYTYGLGFDFLRTLFKRSVAELAMGETGVYLLEHRERTQPTHDPSVLRSYQRHWTPVHLDLVVKDIDAAVATAIEAGAHASGERTIHSWGKLAPLSDPFGNGICVLEFSAAGYDSVAD